MGKIIILEGPDGGGKTTLAKALIDKGYRYRHEGPPPLGRSLTDHYLRILNETIESPFDFVHDRLWLGERIYGPVARGVDNLGLDGQKLFMRLHNSKSILQVICLPSTETAERNYSLKIKDQHDYLKSMSHWKKVYDLYFKWAMDNSGLIYNYEENSPQDILSSSDLLWLHNKVLPKGAVGSRSAKYLFIGDRPNHESIDVPFHALDGSSGFLNQAIELAGLDEKDIAFSNASGPKGEKHNLSSLIDRLPMLSTILLMGNVALEWYRKELGDRRVTFKTYQIPHPSYVKRFKGNNPELMADAIRSVING